MTNSGCEIPFVKYKTKNKVLNSSGYQDNCVHHCLLNSIQKLVWKPLFRDILALPSSSPGSNKYFVTKKKKKKVRERERRKITNKKRNQEANLGYCPLIFPYHIYLTRHWNVWNLCLGKEIKQIKWTKMNGYRQLDMPKTPGSCWHIIWVKV